MERFQALANAMSDHLRTTREQAEASEPWALAELRDIAADRLIRGTNDRLGQLMLALAVAFNDLKGLVLFERYLLSVGRPAADDFSGNAGQWRGVMVQVHRYIGGVLHETIELLRQRHSVEAMETEEFRDLVAELEPINRTAWDELVGIATADDARKPAPGTSTYLLSSIRNNAAFHYKPHALTPAFGQVFVDDAAKAPTAANRVPKYSAGRNMDQRRFYFADAATQRAMRSGGVGGTATDDAILRLAERMNMGIAALVLRFIERRAA